MATAPFILRRRAALIAALLAAAVAAPAASAQSSRRSSRSASSRRVASKQRTVKSRAVDWPNPEKARRALSPRNFKKNIVDPALAEAEVVAIEDGREAFARGGAFGTVFKVLKSPGRFIAFRVFHPDKPSTQAALESGKIQRRYKKLERKFDSLQKSKQLPPELVDFEYVSRGYKVGKRTFPAIKMPWLVAQPLDSWVRGRLDSGKPEALAIMARNWRRAMIDLDTAGVAHGDLRDANVLVEGDGTMRFVDYDAMYTEELAGDANPEVGHPNYQHPFYFRDGDPSTKRPYDKTIDHFSSIVIYLSLLAVADDPGLWQRHNDDFQLIFSKEDLADPDNSAVFQELAGSNNATVKKLAGKLASYAKGPPDQVPSLEQALGGRTSRKPAFGRRETGGVLVDDQVTAEAGGTPMLAKRLGLRSRRALGSARTGNSVRATVAQEEQGNGSGEAPAVRGQASRGQSQRVASRRGQSARGESARGRFEQIVPTIEGNLPRVSSGNPGLLLVLTDNSDSMKGQFAGQNGISKSQALAEVVNQTLADLVGRFRSGDRVKDTMDVAAYSYFGSQVVPAFEGPLAGEGIVKLPELATGTNRIIDDVDDNGEPFSQPVWVEPRASGRTPMTRGFTTARSAVTEWRRRRNPSKQHLVLAVHVTDGESTDGDPGAQIAQLASEVEAQNGKLLLTNIHLSSSGDPDSGVIFPTAADAERFDAFGRRLFEQSSVIPEQLRQKLNRMGKNIPRGARMMAYNANVEDLAFLFEAGSSSAIE